MFLTNFNYNIVINCKQQFKNIYSMNNKEIYVTPTLDVEVIKTEQGIAQTSSGAPSATPTSNGWDELSESSQYGEGS